jgi:assimilatory nitrate reductase catalytic subunit
VDLGLRGASQPLLVPCNISLGGNTVTLAQPLAEEIHSESVLRRLLDVPAEVELVSYSDPGKGCFRYAAIAAGRLLACAFFGPPGWDFSGLRQAKSLLGRDISALDRITLLAGIDTSGETETGKTVCASFSVSEDKICAAIRGQDLKTVAEIGMALQAGTNCGSCIPELKKLLGAPSPVLVA